MACDYSLLFNQAYRKICDIRNPRATRPDTKDLKWNMVEENVMFSFKNNEFMEHENVLNAAKSISFSCMQALIGYADKNIKGVLKPVNVPSDDEFCKNALFAYEDIRTGTVIVFKEVEESPFWQTGRPFSEMENEKIKYVYLILDYAYLQVIGHDGNENDPGQGHNVYSLKWFWSNYFGEEEYEAFRKEYIFYMQRVEEYTGYISIKTLTKNSLLGFRRIVENTIVSFDYDFLSEKQLESFDKKIITISQDGLDKLRKGYIHSGIYRVLLGNKEYAESIVTAEWLYTTMKQAKAIDLTVIATGYFKAIEQLLATLICMPRNHDKKIKLGNNRIDIKNIDPYKDLTLGSMSLFYKFNLNIFNSELGEDRHFVKELIFEYTDLRNGYFHKHNIHSWQKIDEIRKETYALLFAVLGAHSFSLDEMNYLGAPNSDFDDYYRLCEYMNYHSDEMFFIDTGNGNEDIFRGSPDPKVDIAEEGFVLYSGVYIQDLGRNATKYRITKDNLPQSIYLAKLVFEAANEVRMTPVKVVKIFENGLFVGPNLILENDLKY